MEISGVSSIRYDGGSMQNSVATLATGQKNVNVQNEIAIAVLKQSQDQQEMMAKALIDMMKNSQIDMYA